MTKVWVVFFFCHFLKNNSLSLVEQRSAEPKLGLELMPSSLCFLFPIRRLTTFHIETTFDLKNSKNQGSKNNNLSWKQEVINDYIVSDAWKKDNRGKLNSFVRFVHYLSPWKPIMHQLEEDVLLAFSLMLLLRTLASISYNLLDVRWDSILFKLQVQNQKWTVTKISPSTIGILTTK